jgi:hypothetical protein
MNNGVVNLEPIYAAFFALISNINNPACIWIDPISGNPTSFAVASRVPRDWSQLTPGQLPALFQEELGFEIAPTVPTIQARSKYELRVDVVVIVSCAGAKQQVGAETQIPTQALNLAITAVLEAVTPTLAGNKQTLGGLVDSVVAKGRVERINGLPGAGSQLSIAVVPFTILTI